MTEKHTKGFTLIELAVVLLIIGFLINLILPMARNLMNMGKQSGEKLLVQQAKVSLMNYAKRFGGFPEPLPGNKFPAQLLGYDATSVFGGSLFYDINSAYTITTTGGNFENLCKAPITDSPAGLPGVWSDNSYSNPSLSGPAIFVVFSAGADRVASGQNTPVGTAGDRRYENSAKTQDTQYDDIVENYSPSNLCQLCMQTGFACHAPVP
ncbi:MAG: prepilin-type N-terminal cleavage/methylation domain-containing protein [Gammaproteobacteria bacterium]|nr:prepilin-type N-terminal cleavage/methylation domain-containing protein [Gammaproteobacteria bacterium]